MRGCYHLISDLPELGYQDQTDRSTEHREIHMRQPPAMADIRELIGGELEKIQGFGRFITSKGIYPCIAFQRTENQATNTHRASHPNHLATLLWQLAESSTPVWQKKTEPHPLIGPIVVVTGDVEFLQHLERIQVN